MKDFFQVLADNPVLYVSRDAERALALSPLPPGFFVLTNEQSIQETQDQVIGVASERLLSTAELLSQPEVKTLLLEEGISQIMVFKPTRRIEQLCEDLGVTLINPAANLAAEIEEKITQVSWLGDLAELLPPHYIAPMKEVAWNGEAFIIQFNRAHTGSGTVFIENETDLQALKDKFPDRPARVSAFIDGYTITNNTVVTADAVIPGNISYQITGLAPFTKLPFATIGNDFALPNTLLNYEQQSRFFEIANAVGKHMQAAGWKGAFGIDVMVEKATGKLYLLEINARQPASVAFESLLQEKQKSKRNTALTTFEAHLLALLEQPLPSDKLIPLEAGAQIVLRKQEQSVDIDTIRENLTDYRSIPYHNTKPESDLLRIQVDTSLMKDDGLFNEAGEAIAASITGSTPQ